jgi:GAF domain-containing protein
MLKIEKQITDIFLTESDEEVYKKGLQTILDVMESKYGIFGYIDKNGDLACPAVSRKVWDKCQIPEKYFVFLRKKWKGYRGRAINEKKSILSHGPFHVPEGHIKMTNTLVVPILYQDKPIGIVQVANKATNYNEGDQALLENIAAVIAPFLWERIK